MGRPRRVDRQQLIRQIIREAKLPESTRSYQYLTRKQLLDLFVYLRAITGGSDGSKK